MTPALLQHSGVFVSLYKQGKLRGCIGRFTPDMPLYELVQEMAIASALNDHRFSPLKIEEVPEIKAEISVLSPLKRIRSMEEIELGRHGIYIQKGSATGTFLPQVALNTGWSREEFIEHCASDKAGIGRNGWKDAELYTYEAVIIKEEN
jgi:AmmeMemoRadiSam system protein A